MQTEKIMTEVANEHSYETWGKMMYDTHEHSQIGYTAQAMQLVAVRFKQWCENGNAYFFDNNEQHTHTNEELFAIWNEQS